MSPETVSTGDEGEGHSMLMDRKRKMRGNQQWRVWWEESGDWDYQKRSGEYGMVCKVEDSHRDKTEQCPWYSYSRESLSCTEFFAGLKPVKILKQRCDVGSFTCTCVCLVVVVVVVFSMRRAEQFCMRRWLWTEEAGGPEKTMAVVKAWQNKWNDQS